MEWTPAVIAAFVTSSIATIAMWWIYFNIGAEYARDQIAASSDPGRIARFAYTYLHILLVAGIIIVAVADELILAHPVEHEADIPTVLTALGGTATYIVGNALFKRFVFGRWPLSHIVGTGLLFLLALVAFYLTPLAIGSALMAILIVVAAWEYISLRSMRH
jgi:low temperature requirement protein LtrA